MVIDPAIESHIGTGYERTRLFPGGRPSLEFVRSMELLERLLPAPPARVLDVGGGPGTYAMPLAQRGASGRSWTRTWPMGSIEQARRVLTAGGRLMAMAVCRFASLLDGLCRDWLDDPGFRPIVDQDLADGQHRNPDPVGRPEILHHRWSALPTAPRGTRTERAPSKVRQGLNEALVLGLAD